MTLFGYLRTINRRHLITRMRARNFTGSDGIARSCKLKTALGGLTRPAVKLARVSPKDLIDIKLTSIKA